MREELRRSAPRAGSRVGAMAAYHMGWADAEGRPCEAGSGKMLRASLALWAAGAAGGDARDALPAAVAVEWIHNFTLVHDDIQDGDRERRHRATLWTVVGQAQAINAGDALHSVAHGLLTRPGPRPARRLRAAHALDRAVIEVIDGQCLDIALEGRPPARPAVSLRLARTKTGALFGGALEAGALLGGARAADAARLRRAGRDVGAAFQVRDDWLGTWGDPSVTGKSSNADLDRRKQTYGLAVAWSRVSPAGRREMRRLIREPGPAGTPRLREILDAAGAGPRTAAAAADLAEAAVRGLDGVRLEAAHRAELERLAAYAARRDR
ncbi:MAG TPA: polyprenyl synthetase family protein [Candidatus Dormibacteraeota bacterium]|nr:polyprenyl synthetase family protein [Candidatus Dormibacteraeota bacterium]